MPSRGQSCEDTHARVPHEGFLCQWHLYQRLQACRCVTGQLREKRWCGACTTVLNSIDTVIYYFLTG